MIGHLDRGRSAGGWCVNGSSRGGKYTIEVWWWDIHYLTVDNWERTQRIAAGWRMIVGMIAVD